MRQKEFDALEIIDGEWYVINTTTWNHLCRVKFKGDSHLFLTDGHGQHIMRKLHRSSVISIKHTTDVQKCIF